MGIDLKDRGRQTRILQFFTIGEHGRLGRLAIPFHFLNLHSICRRVVYVCRITRHFLSRRPLLFEIAIAKQITHLDPLHPAASNLIPTLFCWYLVRRSWAPARETVSAPAFLLPVSTHLPRSPEIPNRVVPTSSRHDTRQERPPALAKPLPPDPVRTRSRSATKGSCRTTLGSIKAALP